MSRTSHYLFRRSSAQKHCPACNAVCPVDLIFCTECGASVVNAPRVNRNPTETARQFPPPPYLSREDALHAYDDTAPAGTGLVWLGLVLIAVPAATQNVSPVSVGAWIAGLMAVLGGVARTRFDGQAMLRAGAATGLAGAIALGVVGNGVIRGPDTSIETARLSAIEAESTQTAEEESASTTDSESTFDGAVPMLRGSPSHTGAHPGPSIEGNPYRAWKYDTGLLLSSTPAIARGSAYFGTRDGYLVALDLLTNLPRWKFDLDGYPVSSAPAVYDRMVFVGSGYAVYAVDADRGVERWRFPMSYAGESSPTVAEGVVYVASKEHYLYALDAASGEKIWSYRTDGLIYGSPTLSDELVLVGGDDGDIFAVDRESGILRWKYAAPSGVFSTISVDNGLAIVTLNDQTVIALDVEDGQLEWEYSVGGNASPAIDGMSLYVGSKDGAVYAFNVKSGGPPDWLFPTGNGEVLSPVVVKDLVIFAAGPTLFALDRTTGDLVWQYPIGANATTEPVVVDGRIYIGADDGNLYAIAGDADLVTPKAGNEQ